MRKFAAHRSPPPRALAPPMRTLVSPVRALAIGATALALVAGCTKQPEAAPPPAAEASPEDSAELTALIDRAAIQNLYAEYYSHLGVGPFDYSQFFTEDGVLDVNGLVATGAEEIKALYVRSGGGAGAKPPPAPSGPPRGRFHMQLTNLKVEVSGDTASMEAFWSSMEAPTVVAPPKVTEYGREQGELVKRDGHWLISKRIVTSYGGMPEGLLKSYKPR